MFGNLEIDYAYASADSVSNYRRQLDLQEAVTTTSFKRGGVSFVRESFTSFTQDVGVIHLTAVDSEKTAYGVGLETERLDRIFVDFGEECSVFNGSAIAE